LIFYPGRWVGRVDVVIWIAVMVFFFFSALINGGDVYLSLFAAGAVVSVMTIIGASIEVIIEIFRNMRKIGTVLGFVTNGPEMVVLVVGIATGDVLFGISTPLGSSVINPFMLVLAVLVSRTAVKHFRINSVYTISCIVLTVILALLFYILPEGYYWVWIAISFLITVVLFILIPEEKEPEKELSSLPLWVVVPALVTLLVSGYFLDIVVAFARDVSNVPKGLIGFLVLATLSSWPELKSTLVFFRKNRIRSAAINIYVSNISNIWLAVVGVVLYLFFY